MSFLMVSDDGMVAMVARLMCDADTLWAAPPSLVSECR